MVKTCCDSSPPPLFLPGSIYGFNVGVSRSVQQGAAKRGIPLRLHSVIYKLIDELKEELSAKLPPLVSRNVLGETLFLFQTRRSHDLPVTRTSLALSHCGVAGEAMVLTMFDVSVGKKKIPVAGCRVQKGQLDRRLKFQLIRGRDTVWEGESQRDLVPGSGNQALEVRGPESRVRGQGTRVKVQGPSSGDQEPGFRVSGSRVQGAWSEVWGPGSRFRGQGLLRAVHFSSQ